LSQLFAKKSLKVLLDEMAGEHRLKRVLGPVSLSALGIGAIIGTGIFVLTGLAARNYAGPGLVVSYVIAGLACAFAALCYAEFASMAPVAGSAYTYAYTTLGELMAWIIGWDLVLEYAMGSATVANGWSNYFLKFLGLFKNNAGAALITIPAWLITDPFTAAEQHKDYLAAKHLVVETVTAHSQDGQKVTLPTTSHRVENVEVKFTAESIAETEKELGEHAKAAIARVTGELQGSLQFDAKTDPQTKLRESVVHDVEGGFRAYSETPLVFGSVHLTFNVIAILIVSLKRVKQSTRTAHALA